LIKSDSNRLLQALIISIVFHILVFFGMNMMDWFKEVDISPGLPPVTLRIEKFSQNIEAPITVDAPVIDDVDKSESSPIPVPKETEQVKKELNSSDSSSVRQVSTPKKVEYNAYADLSSDNYSSIFSDEPDPLEKGVEKTPYVPSDKNEIVLEKVDSSRGYEDEATVPAANNADTRVVSGEAIDDLIQRLDKERDSGIDTTPEPIINENNHIKYNEFPVEFSNSQVNRYLENKPTVNIPAEFSSYISSEITVIVKFYLNANGILHRFDMIRDSGYSEIDSSIISELRKWVFNTDSGSEDVEGTVTIILKGK